MPIGFSTALEPPLPSANAPQGLFEPIISIEEYREDNTCDGAVGDTETHLAWCSDEYKGYDTPWQILSSIHLIESGRQKVQLKRSSAGAVGPMQFMPCTWYKKNGVCKSKLNLYDLEWENGRQIDTGKGYYYDKNGDDIADARNLQDAIGAANRYLQANYKKSGSWWTAVWHYNHAAWYVNKVLNEARVMGWEG